MPDCLAPWWNEEWQTGFLDFGVSFYSTVWEYPFLECFFKLISRNSIWVHIKSMVKQHICVYMDACTFIILSQIHCFLWAPQELWFSRITIISVFEKVEVNRNKDSVTWTLTGSIDKSVSPWIPSTSPSVLQSPLGQWAFDHSFILNYKLLQTSMTEVKWCLKIPHSHSNVYT